jgi:hypothetical protein
MFILAASLGFGLGGWGGVTPVRAQVSVGRCTYNVYIPLALRNFDGSTGGTGTLAGFTPPDADFNGDGYADVAIGVPREDVFYNGSDRTDAGAVNILYGTENGLSVTGYQILTQDHFPGAFPEAQDSFGQALAAADFDGNGCTDLAVGVPNESIYLDSDIDDAGAVYVFYGTPTADGLDTTNVQTWYQGSSGIQDSVEAFDTFGSALGAGDFDSDGYADLAIGVPFEEIDGNNAAGAVHVLYGSTTGLTAAGSQFFDQSEVGGLNDLEAVDLFGSAFAAGDYDGDGYQDLAIGVPGEDDEQSGATDAGAVWVVFGSSAGLSSGDLDALYSAVQDEHLGSSLAAGDFDANGYTDLAVGAPNNSDQATNGGRVLIHYGASQGLVDLDTLDKGGEAAQDEYFGASLTVGDFDANGAADLVIGIPGESSIESSAGSVWVLYGVPGATLPSQWDFVITQGDLNGDGAEADDEFGSALTTGDYNGDGAADLIVGSPRESLASGEHQAGGVHEIYGFPGGGLTLTGNVFWTQNSIGIGVISEDNDFFGDPLR